MGAIDGEETLIWANICDLKTASSGQIASAIPDSWRQNYMMLSVFLSFILNTSCFNGC